MISSTIMMPQGKSSQCPFCNGDKYLSITELNPETGDVIDFNIPQYGYPAFILDHINNNNKKHYEVIDCYCRNCYVAFSTTAGLL